jgi:hypothetical protein
MFIFYLFLWSDVEYFLPFLFIEFVFVFLLITVAEFFELQVGCNKKKVFYCMSCFVLL